MENGGREERREKHVNNASSTFQSQSDVALAHEMTTLAAQATRNFHLTSSSSERMKFVRQIKNSIIEIFRIVRNQQDLMNFLTAEKL